MDGSPAEFLKQNVLEPMKKQFIGKDEIIDLFGIALTAGEHLFIFGPPGTAKSALVRELGRRIHGQTFEYLLTRFTEPNELFGPFDIRQLREGVLKTNTEGMLPEAVLVFFDELFNANSAILNSLLTVLNERQLRRGRELMDLPLLMAVGASNALPEEDALRALFDRFLLRVRSSNVPGESLEQVLVSGWKMEDPNEESGPVVSVEDVHRLHGLVRNVDLTPVIPCYLKVIARLRRSGLPVSDRRAVKLQNLVAASAVLCSRCTADPSDLWVVRYAWESPEQEEILAAILDEETKETVAKDSEVSMHPRAQLDVAPDAEELQANLEEIGRELAECDESGKDDERLRDRLSNVASRVPWVANDTQREALQARIEAMWESVESGAGVS